MLLRSVAAAALAVAGICVSSAASAAPADNPVATQGVIGGDYMYTSYNHGFGHTDTYGGEVGGIVPFASEWSGQLSGGYHAIDLSGGGPTFDDWNVEGTIFYDKPWGRLGA